MTPKKERELNLSDLSEIPETTKWNHYEIELTYEQEVTEEISRLGHEQFWKASLS